LRIADCRLRNVESEIPNSRARIPNPKSQASCHPVGANTSRNSRSAKNLGALGVLAREKGKRGSLSQRRKDAKPRPLRNAECGMWNPKSKIAEPESAVRNPQSEIPGIASSCRSKYLTELAKRQEPWRPWRLGERKRKKGKPLAKTQSPVHLVILSEQYVAELMNRRTKSVLTGRRQSNVQP